MLGFLFGYSPSQFDLDQMQMMFGAAFTEFGEDNAHQAIALRVHVSECGRDKDSNRAPTVTQRTDLRYSVDSP